MNFKKILFFIPIVLCSFSCDGGSNMSSSMPVENNKFMIEGTAFGDSFIDINVETLNAKMSVNDSFLVLLYSPQCQSCLELEPIILNYMKESKAKIYRINVVDESFYPTNGLINYLYTPTIAIVNEGEVINKINPVNHESIYASSMNMKKFFDVIFYVSKKREISSEEILDRVIDEVDKPIIYYSYKLCGDCSYFAEHYLNDKVKDNNIDVFYEYDMSYYFENREDSSSPVYKNFTDKYGLSFDGNNELGYKNGVVPTVQKYINKELVSSKIIFNDEMSYELSNGEIVSLTIISSYYEDNPFIGNTFYTSEEKNAINLYKESTLKYYIAKFESIFNE